MKSILNATIKEIRKMTEEEINLEGWDKGTTVLVLDNGIKLYASRDDEGNNAGTLFSNENGQTFIV